MKRFFLILQMVCWLLPSVAYAANNRSQAKDSLLRVYLSSQPDTTRLQVLYQLAALEQHSPAFLYYGDKLLKEATEQKNSDYVRTAVYIHIIYYYNQLDQKHARQWMHLLEKLSEKDRSYDLYFRGKSMMIEFHIINHRIELALAEAEEMMKKAIELNNTNGKRKAYLCLLGVYFDTARYKEGIEALNQALNLGTNGLSLADKAELLTKAVLAYSFLRDNEQLLHYTNQLKSVTDAVHKAGSASAANSFIDVQLLTEIQYAYYHIRDKQAAKALKHLQATEQYLTVKSFLPFQLHRLIAYAEYHQLVGENDQALEYLNRGIDLIAPVSPQDALRYQLQKASLLTEMARTDEALALYRQTAKQKDSLFTAFSAEQTEQIQSAYHINRLLWYKEHRQRIIYRVLLFVAITAVISLLFYTRHMYTSRKRLRQDEQEMRRLAVIAEEANEVKSRFLANMSYNIRIPLNNVVGFSQLLSNEDNEISEEERTEYSAIVQSNAQELIRLINDILDLSRLEANMMKFQLQVYPLQEWCNDLPGRVRMQSEGNIRLSLQDESGSACILTDVKRLTEVVMSMLVYPTDCSEQREVKMHIAHHAETGMIEFRIMNSPLTDPAFSFSKVSVKKRICQLFFEHFGGTCLMEKGGEIRCTYPANQETS